MNHLNIFMNFFSCLLYTSDAADDMQCVDLGGRRIIKKSRRSRSAPCSAKPHAETLFFQAEDGIRDVERSRGLGDVYKRQVLSHTPPLLTLSLIHI